LSRKPDNQCRVGGKCIARLGGPFVPNVAACREALSNSGLSREEVAVRARVSYPTISRFFAGKVVSQSSAKAIAKALSVKREEIEQLEAAHAA
jgi:transcriptional regulator with XRE-family HTH domain